MPWLVHSDGRMQSHHLSSQQSMLPPRPVLRKPLRPHPHSTAGEQLRGLHGRTGTHVYIVRTLLIGRHGVFLQGCKGLSTLCYRLFLRTSKDVRSAPHHLKTTNIRNPKAMSRNVGARGREALKENSGPCKAIAIAARPTTPHLECTYLWIPGE